MQEHLHRCLRFSRTSGALFAVAGLEFRRLHVPERPKSVLESSLSLSLSLSLLETSCIEVSKLADRTWKQFAEEPV